MGWCISDLLSSFYIMFWLMSETLLETGITRFLPWVAAFSELLSIFISYCGILFSIVCSLWFWLSSKRSWYVWNISKPAVATLLFYWDAGVSRCSLVLTTGRKVAGFTLSLCKLLVTESTRVLNLPSPSFLILEATLLVCKFYCNRGLWKLNYDIWKSFCIAIPLDFWAASKSTGFMFCG